MTDKVPSMALQPDFELHWYRIKNVLGQGAFGITYLAHDINLDRQVAIKEYLPTQFSVRQGECTVRPTTEDQKGDYEWGLQRFISEARTLTKFEHPNLVRVFNVFEMNGTAYMVMNYEVGKSLQQILKSKKTLSEKEITKIIIPLMSGLQLMHAKGFVHRDIKPGNIFIRGDGSPVLLDFGSARQTRITTERGDIDNPKTLTTLVSPGYAPIEQYGSKSDRQGPWTDIYGLGATIYKAISGVMPVSAVDRGEAIVHDSKDPFIKLSELCGEDCSKPFLYAVDHAMEFRAHDRPQSISDWRVDFGFTEVDTDLIVDESILKDFNDAPTIKVDEIDDASEAVTKKVGTKKDSSEAETVKVKQPDTFEPAPVDTEGETTLNKSIHTDDVHTDAKSAVIPPEKLKPGLLNQRNLMIAGGIASVLLIGVIILIVSGGDEPTEADTTTALETPAKTAPGEVSEFDALFNAEPEVVTKTEAVPEDGTTEMTPTEARTVQDEADIEAGEVASTEEEESTEVVATTEEDPADKILMLLIAAEEDIAALRLTSPKDNNAFDKYLAVLKLDENNESAKAGIQAIANKYVSLAYSAMDKNEFDRAATNLRKASAITPDSEKIAQAKETLETRRAEHAAAAEAAAKATTTETPAAPEPEPAVQETASTEPVEEEDEGFWSRVKQWHEENQIKNEQYKKETGDSAEDKVRKVLGGQ